MKRIVCFGELMMRLNPPGYLRLTQAKAFDVSYAGGEANVAASLAAFGHTAAFVTKLPENDLGRAGDQALREVGVDTSHIVWGGSRIGIYFVEKGASQRPSKVVYDRTGSAVALARTEEFDWADIFKGADWFHFTGITPALGGELAAICLEACKYCRSRGIPVSCDLNYRNKLWSREQAGAVMAELCQYVNVCFANEEDAADVFGIHAPHTDVAAGQVNREGYRAVAAALQRRFGFDLVAITLRTSLTANDNRWAAMCYDGEQYCFSSEYDIHIVDRVGGGDSFCGGMIYARLAGYDLQQSIEFAVAASCLKHTIEGDFNRVSVEEVLALTNGDGSGRVQR